MSSTYRRGTKVFTVAAQDDRLVFRCSCEVFTSSEVVVVLPAAQGRALLEGKPAREVLAGHPFEVVELFRTGLTPAEFDQVYGGEVKPSYPHYVRAGAGVDEPAAPRGSTDGIGSLF